MKGKLIKLKNSKEGNFALKILNKDIPLWAKTSVNFETEPGYSLIASTSIITPFDKLSLKNCEAIELGYDLGELAELELKKETAGFFFYQSIGFMKGFNEGFQKALEIIGDKKFNEEELSKAYYRNENRFKSEPFEFFVQSLQQNEWDVEILMEENCPYDYTSRCTQGRCDCKKPKLDADNCLIIKRI